MMRRFLPKTLFMRAVLIVVLPTVLVQVVTAFVFYDRHWDNVTRHMSSALAGEIAFLSYQASSMSRKEREALYWIFQETTGLRSDFKPGEKLSEKDRKDKSAFPEFSRALDERIDLPYAVRRLHEEGEVEIRIQLSDGVLSFQTTLKRLDSSTTTIFILWMVGASLVLLCIALLFLRNQVRPIKQLAEAAESFGKGQDISYFKPYGALEVRRAARAFLVMRERIQRQIRTRTDMLAGISHDLRTPLSRMKLELALLGETPEVKELQEDVAQMEHMIAEYLDFARGGGGEESVAVNMRGLLEDIVADYKRMGHVIPFAMSEGATMALRPQAFRRLMHNLLDNALRFGKQAALTASVAGNHLEISVDDDGPGIPAEMREEVFRPFTRLDTSRNSKTGGVGLGLTIAQDVVQAHGGSIALDASAMGGLRVTVRLPL